MKRISIGTWAYTIGPYKDNPVPFGTVVKKLKDLKFDGLELGAFNFHRDAHPNPVNCATPAAKEKVKGLMKDAGLEFSGIAADLWNYPGHEMHLVDARDGGEAYVEECLRLLKFTDEMGIKLFRVDTVQDPDIMKDWKPSEVDDSRKQVVKVWKRAAKEAAKLGIDVSWEFEPGFAFNRPSDIVRIIDEINEPNFGAMFDTCHSYTVAVMGHRQTGGPKETLGPNGVLELARKLRGKINHIQLIDSDGSLHDNHTSTHNPFGEGKIDFPPVLEELNEHSGVKHDWWTIDLCFWPDAWPGTEKAKKAVDQLNNKYGGGIASKKAP